MTLLIWLTLIYTVILVVVLAVSLILILAALTSINRSLARIAPGLKSVEGQTAPLEAHVSEINKGLVLISQGLKSVDGHLSAVGKGLDSVVAIPAGGGER